MTSRRLGKSARLLLKWRNHGGSVDFDIQEIIRHLRDMGIGVLITDHNVRETLKITDRAYIINNGEILKTGSPEELSSDPQVKKIYLGEEFTL